MSAEDLNRKKRVRAGHKASASRMINKVDERLAEDSPSTSRLSQVKLSLVEKLDVLKQLDSEILALVEEDGLADEIERSDEFREGAYAAIVRIDDYCSRSRRRSSVTPSAGDAADSVAMHRVRLPKLTIRPFNGELTTWTTFWDSYRTAIHENSSLSDIDKFNYLRSLLERTALEAISGLTLTAANYLEAVLILEKRFGNKQQIVAKHMDALLNIEGVTSPNNIKGLRHLYDLVESHVRSLNSLGVTSDSYGSLLASVLINRLPQELQLIISRRLGSGEWKLDALMKLVEEEVQARERAAAVSTGPGNVKRSVGKDQPTAAALLAGGSGNGPTCSYCRQGHPSHSCGVVTQPEARRGILQRSGRCFVCLRKGHIGRECPSSMKCFRCGGRHHVSICFKGRDSRPRQEGTSATPLPKTGPAPTTQTKGDHPAIPRFGLDPEAPTYQAPPERTASLWVNTGRTVLLQTAQAQAFNPRLPQISRQVRIVLDSGSQRSYVTERVREELALTSEGEQTMTIMTFGSEEQRPQTCESVKLSLALKNGHKKCLSLYTVPLICEPLTCQPIVFCQDRFEHLTGLDLADPSDGSSPLEVDVLIGCDQYWELTTGQVRRGKSGPVALQTNLGWVLSGPITSPSLHQPSTCLITHTLRVDSLLSQDTQALDDRLKSFWELESFGVVATDNPVLDHFRNKIRFTGGRYEVSLPWKDPDRVLPDNYQQCQQRLQGLLRRLRQDQEIMREYDSIIQKQIQHGIVEYVDKSSEGQGNLIHYLPHHAVVRHDKETTKIRVVYDASARSSGPSLNDCLHTGPKFDQNIFDLLLKFRIHRVALTADIEKAFLMVSMAKEDRDVLRFLWVSDVTTEHPEPVELRFTRVVFGVSSSPFLLNATIRYHLENSSAEPTLIAKLSKAFYVDDLITGAEDEEEAYQLYLSSTEVMKAGGFNLRKFLSNSSFLQTRINNIEAPDEQQPSISRDMAEADETYAESNLCPEQRVRLGEKKVLGVCWDINGDHFIMSLESLASKAASLDPTKRNIVSLVGKFYDPLGFLAPIIVRFKVFLQELCGAKLAWDQPLPSNFLKKWCSLRAGLEEGQPISIPRCYRDGVSEVFSSTLCGFCDASLKAYAAVVYLLLDTESGLSVRFVASKTRVAPLKQQTIPRLELLSALLLARLINSVSQSLETEMQLSSPRCFTDSTVTLCWIRGVDKSWKPFVQNRVNEIRKLLPPNHWKHCSGQENPADIPSRGLAPLELSVNVLWRTGPNWLRMADPQEEQDHQLPAECLVEMKLNSVHGLLATEEPSGWSQIIRCEDFSSLNHLLSVTALVLKFCWLLKGRIHHEVADSSFDENSKAEEVWILESQRPLVSDKRFKHWSKQFDLFQDEKGIWRCRGRIQNAAVPYSIKYPILLMRSHYLTKLVVWKAHARVLHNGVKETLTELRSKFWIIKGRSFIRGILRQCQVCRRHEGRPYDAPLPPPLPSYRVEEAPPFSFTGVDFAGPLFVQSGDGAQKVWISLYTCCVVRAVHLDLVPDLSAPAFLRSLKRFSARRGLPAMILSDNAKTFKAAAKAIHAVVSHNEVQRYLAGLGVKWIFNVPKAPWWGGVFERMVKSTKRCLRKIIGQAKLSYDELLTALTEIELVINSRPLSYVSADDLEEALTPSHLLAGRRLLSLPDHLCHEPDEFEVTPDLLTRRARHLNHTLDSFWRRWRSEYLVELRESHRHHKGNPNAVRVSVGDVVVIHGDNQPRGFWKLGKVEETMCGPDGEPRAAVLRVAGKGRSATLLRRPIQRLYPLEVTGSEPHPEIKQTADSPCSVGQSTSNDWEESNTSPTAQRPRRAAASKARDRLKALALSDVY